MSQERTEQFQKMSAESQYLEQAAESLQQRISMLNAAITDLSYANTTLDGIEKEQENAEMIVPIGGSSYVKVKLADTNKIIVGLGAGVSAEKTLAETKATLKERLDELQSTMTMAQQQFVQVTDRMNQLRSQMQNFFSTQGQ